MSALDRELARIGTSARILQLGFGTSDLQNHLRSRGYLNVTNVDYEPLAIERGLQNEKRVFGDVRMTYEVADATQLYLRKRFDLVVDKSTADAISCGGEEAVSRMARGVRRSLTVDGSWVSLSYSSSRFQIADLPFDVQVLTQIPTPKLESTDPDVFHWCYLLRPKDK